MVASENFTGNSKSRVRVRMSSRWCTKSGSIATPTPMPLPLMVWAMRKRLSMTGRVIVPFSTANSSSSAREH